MADRNCAQSVTCLNNVVTHVEIVDRDSFRYIEGRTLAEALRKEIDFDIPLCFEANYRQDTLADSLL